jgi:hypothetical protein
MNMTSQVTTTTRVKTDDDSSISEESLTDSLRRNPPIQGKWSSNVRLDDNYIIYIGDFVGAHPHQHREIEQQQRFNSSDDFVNYLISQESDTDSVRRNPQIQGVTV